MNKFNTLQYSRPILLGSIISLLSACGSGDSSNLTSGRGGAANSSLSLDITDAAVDNAEEVWVEFTGVSIQPSEDGEDQSTLEFTFAPPKRINLLALQGNNVQSLLDDEIIASGSYDWIRLAVNAEQDGTLDSYIKLKDGSEHEFSIPSGSQTGLKINTGFELTTAAEFNYTIDFDLRKSVVLTGGGEYILRPTLRLINNATSATITGTVDAALLSTVTAGCSDDDPDTGNAVYLFENIDATPDDIDNQPENPFSTSLVTLNTSGEYVYTLGFIPEGEYTISFTCESDLDDPETDDAAVSFTGTSNITLTSGQTLSFDF
ncbi:MAG: hypothetical protein DIZ80_00790 [endosymbiont of Galathealinum brachiosum]|uniref:DUF4382 domain-containing protein n=1 Tax=endosymbiont of Galathealinum brachiosum TaxID=2200906 RepID=A0A370DN98_9GAMM|nr:MAG: hypothetical protein DIZ80_00790 [endosymbiont of Galathealinum brachiosum]